MVYLPEAFYILRNMSMAKTGSLINSAEGTRGSPSTALFLTSIVTYLMDNTYANIAS